jgi:hypothetical protein
MDRNNRTIHGFISQTSEGFSWLFHQFVPQKLLLVPLLAILWAVRRRYVRFAMAMCLLALAGTRLSNVLQPHYVAPFTGMLVLLYVAGVRRISLIRFRSWRIGTWLGIAILAGLVIGEAHLSRHVFRHSHDDLWTRQRQDLEMSLQSGGGKAIVIVRYGPGHSFHDAWVYNAADIDASPVVWANDLGPQKNREILDYYRDRTACLVEASGVGKDARIKVICPCDPTKAEATATSTTASATSSPAE